MSYINCHTTAAGRRTCYRVVDRIGLGKNPHPLEPHMKHRIIQHRICQHLYFLFELVHLGENLGLQLIRDILSTASNPDVAVIVPVARDLLKQIEHRFAILPRPHEHSIVSYKMPPKPHPQNVAVNPLQLVDDRTHIQRPLWNLDTYKLFNSLDIGQRMRSRTNPANPRNQIRNLIELQCLTDPLHTSMIVGYPHVNIRHNLAVQG